MNFLCGRLFEKIKFEISGLLKAGYLSCLDDGFIAKYALILSMFDEFVDEYVKSRKEVSNCSKGCGVCCRHWADDVYSFEAGIIADHLIRSNADTQEIIKTIEQDEYVLEKIKAAILAKTEELEKENISREDALLFAFYQMERPCCFLDAGGSCSIYGIRPMICRSFVNTGNPGNCMPENIFSGESKTMIITLDDECENMLNNLHLKYGGDSDFGLRSQVKRVLLKM